VDAEEIARTIGDLENRVERLRSLYDQYFMGIERIEPLTMRKDVDRRLWALRREQIRNTGLRFKLETTIQRYNTYQQYWQRIVREIEAGTYQRDLGRAAKRFGDNAVTAFAKRRAKMFEKGLERKAEREGRRTGAAGSSLAPPPDEEAAAQSEAIDVEFVEDAEPATRKHVAEPVQPLELEMRNGLSSEPPPIPHAAEQRRGPPAAPSPSRGTAPNAPNAPSIPRPAAPGSPPLAPPRAPLPSVTGQPGTPPPRAPLPSTVGQPAAQPPARAPLPSVGQGLPPPRAPLPSHMGQAGPPRAPLPSTTGQPLPAPRAMLASSTGQPPLAPGPGAPSPAKPAAPVATPVKPATPAAATPATPAKPAFAAAATRPSPTAFVSPARSAAGAPVAPTPAAVARPAVVAAKAPPAPFEKPPPARPPAPSVSDAARPPAVLSEDNTLSPIRMRQIYGQFVEAKRKANESTAAVTYEKIAANLENAAKELRAKHKARSVDFEVVMKNGKPVLKPVVKG
jgi:hypothetical protein